MQIATNNKGENATLQNSDLDWTVEKRPVYFPNANGDMVQSARNQVIFRNDTDQPLAVVGCGYEAIQNSQMWEALGNALYDVDHTIVNAGHLDDGGRVFMQARVEDEQFKINGNDAFRGLVTFWSSHDGSTSTQLADTFERVWCSNTFNSSMRGKHNFKLSVKHTKNASVRFDGMLQALDDIFDHRRILFKEIERLTEMPITPTEAKRFAIGMVNSDKTRGLNIAEDIVRKFRKGIGNSGKTRYDLFNGFTEYYTHGTRANPTQKQRNNLIKSSELGAGARAKVNVFNRLLDENKFNDTVSNGSRLLTKSMA